MPSILVRDLDPTTIKRLKAQAARNGRSLQAEAKAIIERGAQEKTIAELQRQAKAFSKRFEGRKMTNTVRLIREDRRR